MYYLNITSFGYKVTHTIILFCQVKKKGKLQKNSTGRYFSPSEMLACKDGQLIIFQYFKNNDCPPQYKNCITEIK